MPIDANILLQGRVPDATASFGQGAQIGQQIRQAPARSRLFESQIQGQNLQNQAAQQERLKQEQLFQLGDMAQDAMMIRPIIESNDPLRADIALEQRIQKIKDRGGDPSHTVALRERLKSGDIQGTLGELDNVITTANRFGVIGGGAGGRTTYAPQPMYDEAGRFIGLGIPTVDQSGVQSMQPVPGSERALDPLRLAAGREQIGVQGYGQRRDIEAGTAGDIAAGSARGRLGVESEIKPRLEASIEQATSDVKTSAEAALQAKRHKKAFDAYSAGVGNLAKSLGATTTVPGMSFIPALTSDAQIAEGAVSSMAPILKDIFREAGEGTFTKDDQAVLLNMLPGRGTLPAARDAQLKNIDVIVRAKLGMPQVGAEQPNGATPPPPDSGNNGMEQYW